MQKWPDNYTVLVWKCFERMVKKEKIEMSLKICQYIFFVLHLLNNFNFLKLKDISNNR